MEGAEGGEVGGVVKEEGEGDGGEEKALKSTGEGIGLVVDGRRD